jgi:hypothetical protein
VFREGLFAASLYRKFIYLFFVFVVIRLIFFSCHEIVVFHCCERKKNELFWAFNKSKRKLLRNEQEENENQTFVHEEEKKELAKEGLYVYLKSQHYHFDRQWKELERPNASFEGRTTHPIIIQLHSNFSFFLFS